LFVLHCLPPGAWLTHAYPTFPPLYRGLNISKIIE
jgi:hypothetical protein